MRAAKHPAAFINVLAQTGTKEEAIAHLQETWDESCDLKEALAASQELLVTSLHYNGNEYVDDTHKQIAANRALLGPIVS
jgi:hypothetical protein